MNRRHVFKLLAGSAAGLLIAERTIFLPPRGGWWRGSVQVQYPDGRVRDFWSLQSALSGMESGCVATVISPIREPSLVIPGRLENCVINGNHMTVLGPHNGPSSGYMAFWDASG